nr:putative ribonuclease H-like domain-containing protein [Tanacetum cinerariifolium]
MSAMGELNFFLGLQVLQKEDGIFLSQDKYIGDILKKFRYSDVRSSNTPMDKENPCGKDGTRKDDPVFPAKVYKVEKAMYGLHQAPRAWYGTLSKYLLMNGFQRGTIDQTLFIRRQRGHFILVQVYVDDITFGSSNPLLCREFEALMHEKFQMSAMGELNFFLGLYVLQKEDGICLSQDKYIGDILNKFGYSDVRSSNTPTDKENPWGKDGTGKDVDLHLYRSMIGSLMYLTASRPDIMFAVCACA